MNKEITIINKTRDENLNYFKIAYKGFKMWKAWEQAEEGSQTETLLVKKKNKNYLVTFYLKQGTRIIETIIIQNLAFENPN